MTHVEQPPVRVPPGALKRPRYEVGHYLAAADLLTEQDYRRQRLRRHNRLLHGWGVVCGLHVVPAQDDRRPWALQVCPGYAIGPYGDEIEVPTPALLDIYEHVWKRPQHSLQYIRVAYVGIRYAEQPVHPLPATPPRCGCADTIYKPSRIRDGFQVDVLWTRPETADPAFDLCAQALAPCPECPESPYVVLARVLLPASEGDPITFTHIENGA